MKPGLPPSLIVALAGGVGGARLADGLAAIVGPGDLSIIVNVADDFDLYSLRICPDLDTVLYTLAGLAPIEQGWGIEGDSRQTLAGIAAYGEEPWFMVSDRDFATHILRTSRLQAGMRLTEVMQSFAASFEVDSHILPVSDDWIATLVATPAGIMSFQDFFVRRRHQDEVLAVTFDGIAEAELTQESRDAVAYAEMVIFCPSNPFLSIDPILGVDGMRAMIEAATCPRVAVSPIVGGRAIKGPADRMMTSLGMDASALGVARLYVGLCDGFVIDRADADLKGEIEALGMAVLVTSTIMRTVFDREQLAAEVLDFGYDLTSNNSAA